MNAENEVLLKSFLIQAIVYLERLNGQGALPLAGTAHAAKKSHKKKAPAEPAPKPEPKPEFPPEQTEAKKPSLGAAPAKASIEDLLEMPATDKPVYEKTEVPLTAEESLSIAKETAKEFVQRFQKHTPDGLMRLRKIMAEVFKATSITAMTHEARVEFIGLLKKEMAEVAK